MTERDRIYRVGKEYRNYAGAPDDQYSSWLAEPLDGGIQPPAGINSLDNPATGTPEFFVFWSGEGSRNNQNPWNDIINLDDGYARYWGDAKPKHDHPEDAKGNEKVKRVYNQTYGRGERAAAPPVLLFHRERSGYVTFKGLCLITGLQISRYRSEGHIVPNYLFDLAILDTDDVPLDWIHTKTLHGAKNRGPEAWRNWVENGTVHRYSIHSDSIREPYEQKPADAGLDLILDVRKKLDGSTKAKGDSLEALIYLLLEDLDNFHDIELTPDGGDRGIDLTGTVDLFGDIQLANAQTAIRFKAQVKNWDLDSGVRGKDLSRLASRIDDGEVGLFITTSYYTTAAQKENYSTYPVRLFAGADLAELLQQTELVEQNQLRTGVIDEIKEVLDSRKSGVSGEFRR